MNKDIIEGNWNQLKAQAQAQAQARWGDPGDDVFDTAEGNRTNLCGRLQEQYGWDRDRAEREVADFERGLN